MLAPRGRNGVHGPGARLDHRHQRDVLAFTDGQIEERGEHVRRLLPALVLELQPPAPAQLGADGVDDLQRRSRTTLRSASSSSAQKAAQSTA
jgi:hypothetical protein